VTDVAPAPGLRRNRNWQLLWWGQAVSLVGDYVFDTTVVLWVAAVIAKDQPWGPAAVGGVLIAASVPMLAVGSFAGVYVDRWNRRRTMLATDLIRAAIIAAMLVVPALGDRLSVTAQLVLVYAGVFAVSCTSQFFNPARFATIGAVVHPEDQPRAGGLSQATAAMAAIIGPPLAAPLLFSVGVQWALAVNAASFLISYAAVYAIRIGAGPEAAHADGEPKRRSLGREYSEGLKFFARNKVLQTIGISVVIVMLGVGALNALDVFFVTENLHADASLLGTLAASFGVGSVVGALLAGAIGGKVGIGRLYWIGLLFMGLALIGYSRTTTLAPAFVLLFLAGVPVAIVNSVVGPILLRVTPAHMLGRIISLLTPLTQLAAILSMAAAGFLASTTLRDLHLEVAGVTFGRIDTIFLVGGVLTVAGALWAAMRLREVDRPAPEPSPEAESTPAPV